MKVNTWGTVSRYLYFSLFYCSRVEYWNVWLLQCLCCQSSFMFKSIMASFYKSGKRDLVSAEDVRISDVVLCWSQVSVFTLTWSSPSFVCRLKTPCRSQHIVSALSRFRTSAPGTHCVTHSEYAFPVFVLRLKNKCVFLPCSLLTHDVMWGNFSCLQFIFMLINECNRWGYLQAELWPLDFKLSL